MPTKRHREIWWLFAQLRPFWSLHFAGFGSVLVASLLVLLDPLIIKFLIDSVLPHRLTRWLLAVAGALLITYFGRIVFDGLGAILSSRAVQKMIFRMRLKLLRRLQSLSAEYYDNNSVGDLLYRLEQDVAQVGELTGQILTFVLRTLVTTFLILLTMCLINPLLTVIIVPLVPAFLFLRRRFQPYLRDCSDAVLHDSGRMSGFLQDHLAAMSQVQILCRELTEARKFANLAGRATRAQIRRLRMELFFAASSSSIIVIAVISVLGVGGYQVLNGSLTVGGLVAFYSYATQLFGPLYGVMDVYAKFQRVSASISRLVEVEEAISVVRDRPNAIDVPNHQSTTVQLRKVSFGYRPDSVTLSDIDLLVGAGERIALVGPSGSGKSTIARLLTRCYEARDGAILVNGHDVRNIKLKSLRSTIGYVPQDPALFDTTVRENLLYGNPKATQCELEEAIFISQLDDVLRRLPKGWHEAVGPRGSKLSGGERQRLALARAILQRPRMLILDECTSALDAATERRLLERITGFLEGKATIIISHRLSTILWADRIVVVERGRVVEEGRHRYLYDMNGVYRRLCDSQFEMETRNHNAALPMPEYA
jgi:ABC-type multidrug transport system fused ATPase/permease subunit